MNKDIKMEKQAQRPYCLLNFNQAEPAYEKQIKSTTTLYQHLDELFHEPELASQAEFAKEVAECREDDKRVIWNAGCTYAMPLAVLGEDEFFIRVVTEPELMRELCERYAIRKADAIVQTLQVMQIRPEVLLFSDPFGKSGLPPLRPAVFRTLLKSAQQFWSDASSVPTRRSRSGIAAARRPIRWRRTLPKSGLTHGFRAEDRTVCTGAGDLPAIYSG